MIMLIGRLIKEKLHVAGAGGSCFAIVKRRQYQLYWWEYLLDHGEGALGHAALHHVQTAESGPGQALCPSAEGNAAAAA